MKRVLSLAKPAALALCLLLALPLPGTAQTTWEMATEYPATAIPGEGVAFFAKAVGEKSGGKLVVQPSFDAAKGIKSADMVAAVRDGRIQAGDAFAGALIKTDPIFALSSLPFVATSIAEAKALADLARPAYQKALDQNGQILLYVTPWPASGIWSKTAVATAADIRGLSIRTYDATSTTVLKAAGANAMVLSFTDVMPKLKDGSLNAVLSSGDGGAGRKLWDYLPHFTEVNYAMPLSLASVNRAAYAALSEPLKKAVAEAAAETEARQWKVIVERLEQNYSRMKSNNVAIAKGSPEVMKALQAAATQPVADWRQQAGPEAAAILDRFSKR